jgi:hypothetical protein
MSNTYSVSNVNIGTVANDGQGDPLRTAFVKINQNFANVYAYANLAYYNGLGGNGGGNVIANVTNITNFYSGGDFEGWPNISTTNLAILSNKLANIGPTNLGALANALANVAPVNLGALNNALATVNYTSLSNFTNAFNTLTSNATASNVAVGLVSNLTANGTANGQAVYNVTDGGLYIWGGNSWISPGAAFTPTANSISGVEIFQTFSLATGPGDGRDFEGRQGFYNNKLYIFVSGGWNSYDTYIAGTGNVVLSANIITSSMIVAGAITAGKIGAAAISAAEIQANAITASLIASNAIIAGKIGAGVITAVEIAANAITATQIAANSIYAEALQANVITANKIAANSITAVQLAANAVYANAIQTNSITAAQIAANAITAVQLAANSVYADAIQANCITANQIAANAVTAVEIAANSVFTYHLVANCITANQIAANAITAVSVAANAITADKIDSRGLTIRDVNGNILVSAGFISGNIPVAIVGGGTSTLEALASSATAQSLTLRNNHAGFGVSNGTYTNTSEITLTADLSGLAGTVIFAVTAGTATLTAGATANERKLTFANMGSDSVTITASIVDGGTTFSDIVSLYKVYNGNTTPLMYLTDENRTLPADSSGTVSSFAGVSTEAVVYEGLNVSTASWTFNSTASGCTISTSGVGNKVINVTAMSADTATVTIVATRSGYASLTRVFKLSKAKAGVAGAPGAPGAPGGAGTRGSIRTSYSYPAPWNDSIAAYAISLANGGSPIITDEVTLYYNASNYSETKVYTGSAWTSVVAQFNGSILVNGTVIASKIATGAITADKIDAGAITAGKISAGAITADKIQAGAITADKISAATITADKIQSSTGTTVSYGKYGFGAGAQIGNYNGVLTAETVNPNYFGIIGASNNSQPGIVAGNRYGLQQGDAFAFFRMSGGQYSSSSTDWRTYGILGGYFIGGQIVCQNDYLGPAPGTPNSIATLAQYGVAAGQFTQFAFGGTELSKITLADAFGNALKVNRGTIVTGNGTIVQFTGSHDGLIELNEAVEIGDILVDVSIVASKNISDAVGIVTKSTQINQKSVFGIMREYTHEKYIPYTLTEEYEYEKITETPFGGDTANSEVTSTIVKDERLNPIYQSLTDTHKFVHINSIGEGLVNVCGENGNIEMGDYITTSSMPGKGMKQDDDLLHNYTVAKARENVTFSSPTEVKQIACSYHCG